MCFDSLAHAAASFKSALSALTVGTIPTSAYLQSVRERFGISLTVIDFTEDGAKRIISILNEANWEDGALNNGYDFEFVLRNATIVYQSDSGILVDKTNERYSDLDLFTRAKLNSLCCSCGLFFDESVE